MLFRSEVDAWSAHLGRPLGLIAESDLNDPRMITPRAAGGRGMTAQWSDDFHHALHVAVTGETDGYYADFEPLEALRKVTTVVADAETTFQMPQGPLASMTKTYVAYPDRFRVDATVGAAQVVQVYNAGAAWVKDPSGVHEAPPPMRDDFAEIGRAHV